MQPRDYHSADVHAPPPYPLTPVDGRNLHLGTSDGVGANVPAGKRKNRINMVDSGAPPTNHENLLGLSQLLRILPLWFAFVLLCFARLALRCPFLYPLGLKFRLLRIASTSRPDFGSWLRRRICVCIPLHIESGVRILL